jgi:hypothetical protein
MSDVEGEAVELTVHVKAKTSKAWLVNDGTSEAWLPLSQIVGTKEHLRDDEWALNVKTWWAEREGFV